MNILVIRISAIGDVVMLATILREAAIHYPQNDYTLLSVSKLEALMMTMPSNVHFLAYSKPIPWHTYHLVIDAHSVWRSWWLDIQALLYGVPVKRIHKPRRARRLLVRHRITSVTPMLSIYRHLLQVPSSVSVPATTQRRTHIGIAPFAAHQGKIYPLKDMEQVVCQLGEAMSQRGEKVILFGAGKQEIDILNQWATRYPGVENVAGKGSLQDELALIQTLRLMLCMDSSNMHFASLMGTRAISIWGATHPNAGFLGYGQQISDCIQLDMACRPCSIYGNQPCVKGTYCCLHIPVQSIIQQVLDCLD